MHLSLFIEELISNFPTFVGKQFVIVRNFEDLVLVCRQKLLIEMYVERPRVQLIRV